MNMRRWIGYAAVVALACLVLSAMPAYATALGPGTTVAPSVFTAGGTIVADTGVLAFSASTLAGTLTGTYREAVYSNDPGNVFGAGNLDFVVWVTVDHASTDSILRVTMASFTGFLANVGYIAIGGTAPSTVDRSGGAGLDSVIGFNFANPGVGADGFTQALEVETNAKFFKPGTVSLIDSGTTTRDGFAPAVPEPSSLLLLGSGLIGMGGFFRRRRA